MKEGTNYKSGLTEKTPITEKTLRKEVKEGQRPILKPEPVKGKGGSFTFK